MDLFLRRVRHPQSRYNYRVVLKDDGEEIEMGSIGVQYDWRHRRLDLGHRHRNPDARVEETEGTGKERAGPHVASFARHGTSLAQIAARLTEFLKMTTEVGDELVAPLR